jgi:CRISPR-associated protein Cas2
MKYLLCYDIPNPKRLRHVAKIMEGFGYRVQKSVFEAFLTNTELDTLTKSLMGEINPREDTIRIYRLCESCDRCVAIIGAGEKIEEKPYIIM